MDAVFGALGLLPVMIVLVVALGGAAAVAASRQGGSYPWSATDDGAAAADVALQDARSVLRPLYLFAALAVSVAVTLYASWQLIFYVLGRALGVPRPGGVGEQLALALAGPASLLVVYGMSWLYHRRALILQALAQPELPRQAGIRRLYVYLVSLLALHVFATGAGGVLWTLADLLTNAPHTINPATWWREQASLHISLIAIGLPVWLRHWGPVARPAIPLAASETGPAGAVSSETASLARRLYLYVTLLVGVLALLGSVIAAVQQTFSLALGVSATPAVVTNLARALSVAIVAGLAVYYHARVLRRDLRDLAAVQPAPPEALETVGAVPAGAPSPARPYGLVYRRGAHVDAAWFPTLAEARAALDRARASAGALDWSTLVRVEEPPPRDRPDPRPEEA